MSYWIQTYTGKKFDLENPTTEMICIEDIAHHLSQTNRFVGACKFAYSVGYHSLLVCEKAPLEFKLDALLHEAEEAYVGDLSTQLKNMLGRKAWNTSMEPIGRAVYSKFKVIDRTFKEYEIIKAIDVRVVNTERLLLLNNHIPNWLPEFELAEPYKDINILKLQPENVEELFLKEFYRLKR